MPTSKIAGKNSIVSEQASYRKSKINLFLPVALIDTVRGLIIVQGEKVSMIRPVFKRSKIASRTKWELSKADLLLLNTFDEGVSIKGIPFSIIS